MKKNLTTKESIALSSMLFGMFFGAGNLIFPAALGPAAGANLWSAYAGLFITAVGLPMLAVAALGKSRTTGIVKLSDKVSHRYALFFSALLYLTIGPLFAIPRCASTSFAVGAVNLLGDADEKKATVIFSFLFFAVVLYVALRPGKVMTTIGKILNPAFLVFLAVLVVAALLNPVERIADVAPAAGYATPGKAFFSGFLEGYNTLDALAGLAFGIVVVYIVRKNGVEDPDRIAVNTIRSGIFSCLGMGVIYLAITVVAAQSSSICEGLTNGGEMLGRIAGYHFGGIGSWLMAAIVTLACLKTAVGLVISCGEAFVEMFPKGPRYLWWATIFCVVSFGIANFGLTSIVSYCVPVLMFIYPMAITIILLALFSKRFGDAHSVWVWTTVFTVAAAVFDFVRTLSSTLQGSGVTNTAVLDAIGSFGSKVLPFSDLGLGWVCPAIVGFIIGLIISRKEKKAA